MATETLTTVQIWDGKEWVAAIPYVWSGKEWIRAVPYVYSGVYKNSQAEWIKMDSTQITT